MVRQHIVAFKLEEEKALQDMLERVRSALCVCVRVCVCVCVCVLCMASLTPLRCTPS